ncbi:MAG: NAD(+) synthase [Candidatus Latescibacterota bacterium]|nr:NAD(+) synthase [Candidatus Latescibacterota bacterium]
MTKTVTPLPRIALVQMEVEPGRPDHNAERMEARIEAARSEGAQVVAFSELCISGYILGDLWEVDVLVTDWASYSDRICHASSGLTVLFGNVCRDAERIGEDGRLRKYNAAIVCHDGQYVHRPGVPPGLPNGVHPKTLHPNYRFFDDDRHFYSLRQLAQAQGCEVADWAVPFEVHHDGATFRFGVQLCEDIWCQDYEGPQGSVDTLSQFVAAGAQAVFNLSASPWTWQKNEKRNRTVRDILRRSPIPFYYVNQVGAQNNGKNVIVFDGDTTAYDGDGHIRQRATGWRETILHTGGASPRRVEEDDTTAELEIESVYQALMTGLRHVDALCGDSQVSYLVATSGGIDSSVVACLLERCFGAERVFAVNMPTRFNAQVTRNNASQLAAELGVDFLSCPIEDLYDQVSALVKNARFPRSEGDYSRPVDENIQARIRFSDVLSGIAAKHGMLFTNNGNKTELALGYTTLSGDLSGAIAPIADLYKTQVFELGEYLNAKVYGRTVIPENLLTRETVPSAELSEAQDVTQGLGDPIKYGYHDALLRQLIEYRHHPQQIMTWLLDGELFERIGWSEGPTFQGYFPTAQEFVDDLEWVDRQLCGRYFKRIQSPPLIVLSKRAFGFDLRETQGWRTSPRSYVGIRDRVLALSEWPPTSLTH